MNKITHTVLSDTKIDLTIQQQDWLRTVLTWLETRGERKRNWMLAIPINWIDSIDEEIKNKMLTDGGLSELHGKVLGELSPATLNKNPAVKKSDKIVFINEPYDLVFNILLHQEYKVEDKTDLNLLGIAYLWYQKEGIKWNGH